MGAVARRAAARAVRGWLIRARMRWARGQGGPESLVDRLPEEAKTLLRRCGLDPAAELTDGDAVRPVRLPLGVPGWLVTGYDEARSVLADHATYSNDFGHLVGRGGIGAEQDPGGLGMTDPPYHTKLRRMLAPEFTGRALRGFRPRIEEIVAGGLEALSNRADDDGRVDLWREWALPVPALTICDLLGLRQEDREVLLRLSAPRFDVASGAGASLGAVGDSIAHLHEVVARERREPGAGLLGRLVTSHGTALTDAELAGIVDGLVTGGLETTASMLALGALMLTQDAEAAQALRSGESPSAYIDGLLRHLSVVQVAFPRFARTRADLAGHVVEAGDVVLVSLSAANRDSAGLGRPHLAFGQALHRCLGAELAKIELEVALPALVRRFPHLRLAVPFERLDFRQLSVVYGVNALPVHLR